MIDTTELCAALLRFRDLLTQGYEPESAFLLAHGYGPMSALESSDSTIKKMLDNCDQMEAILDHSDATLAELQALFAAHVTPAQR